MRRIAMTTVLLTLGLGVAAGGAAQDAGSTDPGATGGSGAPGSSGTDTGSSSSADAGASSSSDTGASSSGSSSTSSSSGGGSSSTSSSSGGGSSSTSSSGSGSSSASSSGGGSSSSTGASGGGSSGSSAGSGGGAAPAGSTVRTYEGRPIVVVMDDDDEEAPPPEGDGRDVDFLYIELEGGYANVNLIAFQGEAAFTDPAAMALSEVSSQGGYGGLGVGFRIYWLAIGARATVAAHQGFELGWVGGEATLRFPIPVVEPYIRAGFSYAWQGNASLSYPNAMSATGVTVHNTTVYGWAFNSAVGIDIYLTNWFTIGVGGGFDLLNMSRQTDPTMDCMGITDVCPSRPGDAVGYNIRGYGQIGFRF